MPELDHITIRGFRSIASIEDLELRDVNVLIGPNGSGKSNFIGAFSLLYALREGELQHYIGKVGGADRILHFGARSTPSLEIRISFADGVNGYFVNLVSTDTDSLFPASEVVFFRGKGYTKPYEYWLPPSGSEAGISVKKTGIPNHVREHLASWRIYHFHDTSATSGIKKTADINDNRFLRPDGSNLPAFLYLLRERSPESYGLIVDTIRNTAPFFQGFDLKPLNLNPNAIRLEWHHARSDAYFDVSSLSDGTLRFMALATLFLQPREFRPSVILIDEPELGLHPHAITLLSAMMKSAAVETQVIVSTQSSLLLDHFDPEDILVAESVDGATQLRRLESGPLQSWLEDYSLGQLWEKGELGGRPHG